MHHFAFAGRNVVERALEDLSLANEELAGYSITDFKLLILRGILETLLLEGDR